MLKQTIISLFFFPFVLSICPTGTLEYNSKCYHFISNCTGFAAAEIYCSKLGGHLASVHDAFTNIMLGEEASEYFHESTESNVWIGGNNLISPTKWNWTDDTVFDYSDWKKGEPQNITGPNCLALSITDGYWSAQDCFKAMPFICETSAAPNYPTFYNCSKGWIYFAPTHSCYGINKGGFGGNWTAANTHCESFNATLPPINNFEEFNFIESYVYYTGHQTWTGVYSVDSGNTWRTTDGSVANFLTFGNWCTGYPVFQNGDRYVTIGYNPDDANNECFREYNFSATVTNIICKKTIF